LLLSVQHFARLIQLITIGRFIVWLAIGLVTYFAYSQRRSHLQGEMTATGSGGGNGGAVGGEIRERR